MDKRHKIALGVLIFLVLAALGKGFLLGNSVPQLSADNIPYLNGQWETVSEEPGCHRYAIHIPEDAGSRLALCVKIYWIDMRFFLEDQLLYTYSDPHGENGAFMHFIPLPEDAAGKTLYAETSSGKNLLSRELKAARIGDRSTLMNQLLIENFHVLVFILLSFTFCLCIFLFQRTYHRQYALQNYRGTVYFGNLLFFAGVWVVTDSPVLQFFTGRTALISLISFISFMAMPALMLLFFNELMIYRSRLLNALTWCYFADIVVCVSLYLLRILPLYEIIFVTHALIVLSMLAMVKCGVREILRYNNREMRVILFGLSLLFVFSAWALISFYLSPASMYSALYSTGFFLFIVCMADAAFSRFHYYAKRSSTVSLYEKMAYEDYMTGIGNRSAYELAYKELQKQDKMVHFIVMDINNLKKTNDFYGHLAGDQMIIDTARCIRKTFVNNEKYFRIGGDEFVVIAEDCSTEDIEKRLLLLKENLVRQNLRREVPIELATGHAYGLCRDGQLFDEADFQMYQNKSRMKKHPSGSTAE